MIPVSRISSAGFCSSNVGGSLWISHFSLASGCSLPSIASPNTLRVFSPTGVLMPLPVAVTSMSLQRPSLEASIIQRTVSLPICCATSITHFLSPLLTSSASLIAGRFSSSNATSTTGPITCIIFPLLLILSPIRRIISFVSSSATSHQR